MNETAKQISRQLRGIEQYINTLETERAEVDKDMVWAALNGLCNICANKPKISDCAESDYICEECGLCGCKCKTCGPDYSNFKWRGKQ